MFYMYVFSGYQIGLKSVIFRFRVQINFRTPLPVIFFGSPDPGFNGYQLVEKFVINTSKAVKKSPSLPYLLPYFTLLPYLGYLSVPSFLPLPYFLTLTTYLYLPSLPSLLPYITLLPYRDYLPLPSLLPYFTLFLYSDYLSLPPSLLYHTYLP